MFKLFFWDSFIYEVMHSEPMSFQLCQTILGETREDEDEILPRKDYEVKDSAHLINVGRKMETVLMLLIFAEFGL